MSEKHDLCGGDIVAAMLEAVRVDAAFGVVSIHNLPILDAIHRREHIRFVPSRGEAGAVNMADAFARVKGSLGVAITSTGTGAGNAAGALIEAATAGTPLLHITGQGETRDLDRNKGGLHDTRDQLGFLRAVSKAAFRAWSTPTLAGTLRQAIEIALTPPMGPVSIEIPIDVQKGCIATPPEFSDVRGASAIPDEAALDRVAGKLARARRPLLWLGGGAKHAVAEVKAFADMGVAIVSSVHGRGILPEDHDCSLGAYNFSPSVESFYDTCDAALVVGSRLRSNETLQHQLRLPRPLIQIDADPTAENRTYACDDFVQGDAKLVLQGLARRLRGHLAVEPGFIHDIRAARQGAQQALLKAIDPYTGLVEAISQHMPQDALWVRDVTISGTSWGNRMPALREPRQGVHALGGGIGQGLAMAIGAAVGKPDRKVVALVGDGGLAVAMGELATAVQERPDMVLIVMNDGGYGVIRNIQDRDYGGRRAYVDLHTPNFRELATSLGLDYLSAHSAKDFGATVARAFSMRGPVLLEIQMSGIGPYAHAFAGPPQRSSS